MMIDAIAVIPVRLESTRIRQKALADLAGKPLLWHVWQQVLHADCFSKVIIATDSLEITDLVRSWSGATILTESSFRNGTERTASIAGTLNCDRIVNIQADMPRINGQIFRQLLQDWARTQAEVITPVYRLNTNQELFDPNLVKVIRANCGRAIYFSRQAIPYLRDVAVNQWMTRHTYWGHIGIYGLTQSALRSFSNSEPCPLEVAESLEQLRFLESGLAIMTSVVDVAPIQVDSANDLARARELLADSECHLKSFEGKGDDNS